MNGQAAVNGQAQMYRQVVTSIGTEAEAQRLARSAVGARLAACAQVSGPVQSTYWWQGSVEMATEWLVVYKTTEQRFAELEEHLLAEHPYEVPEIVCTPIVAGNPGYLAWVAAETGSA